MRWIATVTLSLALAGGVLAAGPDEDYLVIYNQIQQAEALQQSGQLPAAAAGYLQARDAMQKYRADHPASNVAAVNYRLDYLAGKLKELAAFLGATNAVPNAVPVPAPPAKPFSALTPQQQAAAWQELSNEKAQLEMKLKEALSVQPAAVAPGELAKAREKIISLEKERDLLSVALDQQRAAKAGGARPSAASAADQAAQAQIAGLQARLNVAQKDLKDATDELNNLKTRPSPERPVAEEVKQLAAERDKLKSELATVSKELADREAHAGIAPTPGSDAARLKEVEKERDDLKLQIAAMMTSGPSQPAPAGPSGSNAQLEQLRARLKVLEAAAVPYTAEELAVMKSSPARFTAPPVAAKQPAPSVHSVKDLSAAAQPLMRDAEMDARARRYDDAEKKYLEVLRQDENNIYVLAKLGSAEFAAGRLDDCEKNVRRALDLDPNDPGALYLLGILRYRQQKLDDAFDALSRSASFNATNQFTQNYLGEVLADKGLRAQAETAFRKALDIDPGYADAHFNLALVYAAENPPSLNLARWHYQKALDFGHEKSASLEKMLAEAK
jgi:tetratricopeptide (TPR) repeat protein